MSRHAPRLKHSREAEARKVDLAIKYAEQGSATVGTHITPKKARHSIEARFIPFGQPTAESVDVHKKAKRGRHHVPPSTAPREPEGRI